MATLRDVLARKPSRLIATVPTATVLEAAREMNEQGIGGLMVEEGGTLVGMFTERDVLRRVIGDGLDPTKTLVREVMSTPVFTCLPTTTTDEAAAIMTERRIRHLPVAADGGRPEGMVTIGDLLAFRVAEQQATIQFMSSYIYDTR
jgi:CBS domain-containing protein